MSLSSSDMIYRGHLKLRTSVSAIVAPGLLQNNNTPAFLKPQRGKYRISPGRRDSESASPALNNGWMETQQLRDLSSLALFGKASAVFS